MSKSNKDKKIFGKCFNRWWTIRQWSCNGRANFSSQKLNEILWDRFNLLETKKGLSTTYINNPVCQRMLGKCLTAEEKTWGNIDVILQEGAVSTKHTKMLIMKIKDIFEFSRKYNSKITFGIFNLAYGL